MKKLIRTLCVMIGLGMIAPTLMSSPAMASQASGHRVVVAAPSPTGINAPCGADAKNMLIVSLPFERGHAVTPGTFTLRLKDGRRKTVSGSFVSGDNKMVEYIIFYRGKVRKDFSGLARFRVTSTATIPVVSVIKSCVGNVA